ncbi:MAG: TauD/TfdA family dioxygenase, partial [Alphaproteobacteria bacterium]|nr:TauD/TfdA family dioxygenase [Alphaproteobacteria bacterium]
DDLKAAIDGKHQMHDSTRNTANRLAPNATMPTSWKDIEGPVHPMVRIHPETGRKALYLGRRWSHPSTYIVEMPTDAGEALMDRLWAHATQEKYVWTHSWRPGDMLMWDNRCVMHRRTAINPTQPRVMHRTLIKGDPVISAWAEDDAAAQ